MPTLRNVDKRSRPDFVKAYMHNGYFKSLEEVVRFYNTRDVLRRCDEPDDPGEKTDCWPPPEVPMNVDSTHRQSRPHGQGSDADRRVPQDPDRPAAGGRRRVPVGARRSRPAAARTGGPGSRGGAGSMARRNRRIQARDRHPATTRDPRSSRLGLLAPEPAGYGGSDPIGMALPHSRCTTYRNAGPSASRTSATSYGPTSPRDHLNAAAYVATTATRAVGIPAAAAIAPPGFKRVASELGSTTSFTVEVVMRRIRYQVACSLDGYIAGPNGETDWIVEEPEIDFQALFDQFDTLLMGRRTYEDLANKAPHGFWGKKVLVFSRTLRQEAHPDVTVVSGDVERCLDELRSRPGKDIWLFGGGELFRSILELGYVDTVEPAIIPVLLGGGLPFLATPAVRRSLELTGDRAYPSGIVWLEYAVRPPDAAKSVAASGGPGDANVDDSPGGEGSMIEVEDLHHVSLAVGDLERSHAFYCGVLGLEEIERPRFDFAGAWYRIGSRQLHLIVSSRGEVPRGSREIDSRGNHLALRVTSYRAALEHLRRHGVRFVDKPVNRTPWPQIFIADPDGNVIELNAVELD